MQGVYLSCRYKSTIIIVCLCYHSDYFIKIFQIGKKMVLFYKNCSGLAYGSQSVWRKISNFVGRIVCHYTFSRVLIMVIFILSFLLV